MMLKIPLATAAEYRSEDIREICCDEKGCEGVVCEVTKIFIWIVAQLTSFFI